MHNICICSQKVCCFLVFYQLSTFEKFNLKTKIDIQDTDFILNSKVLA